MWLDHYFLYTQKLVGFMKVWGVASEDVGSRADFCSMQNLHSRHPLAFERCRQASMDGFSAVVDRHIPYLLFLDGF